MSDRCLECEIDALVIEGIYGKHILSRFVPMWKINTNEAPIRGYLTAVPCTDCEHRTEPVHTERKEAKDTVAPMPIYHCEECGTEIEYFDFVHTKGYYKHAWCEKCEDKELAKRFGNTRIEYDWMGKRK